MEAVLKSGEVKLMQMLQKVDLQPLGWMAIHFHLSDLLEEYKSEYQVRIAFNLMHDLLKNYAGGIFLLVDNSIIVLCYQLEKAIQDKLIFQLRYLYMDDPLAYADNGQENQDFCTTYDLKRHGRDFFELCSRRMTVSGRKPFPDYKQESRTEATVPVIEVPDKTYPRLSMELPEKELPAQKMPLLPHTENTAQKTAKPDRNALSASALVHIERDLAYADLSKVIRRQPVCAVSADMKVRRVFDEMYIHIAHLRQMLRSEVDFLANRWLFKYLTCILDERMLDQIRRHPDRFLDGPVSINLNVETLLSSGFAEFDAVIRPQMKVSIVIELLVIDAFADMAAFTLARRDVQKQGYRVCLDGLTTASFASINREKLGVDLVKMQWNAELQSDLGTQQNLDLVEAVRATGNNRVILCRCDNRDAVEFGQALGISLFQGRYIDSLLNPNAKRQN